MFLPTTPIAIPEIILDILQWFTKPHKNVPKKKRKSQPQIFSTPLFSAIHDLWRRVCYFYQKSIFSYV